MTAPNQDSAEYWSGPSGVSWIENEQEQDTLLRAANEAILTRADPQEGARVLDIGCGTGALSLDAAALVGERGAVIASDISGPLLARAAERGRGMPQISTLLGDAQSADWAFDPVDLVISRFGVMFFNDPTAAFANIAKALKPGGRMVFAAWGPYAENPWWQISQRSATARLGQPPKVPPNSPGPMGLADMEYALGHLRAAGVQEVKGERVMVDLFHPGGAAALADLSMRIGPARRVVTHFEGTTEDVEAIRKAMESEFVTYDGPDGARVPACLNLLSAQRG